jgi:hypothetical protein
MPLLGNGAVREIQTRRIRTFARECVAEGGSWPKAAELGDLLRSAAISVHRTCCHRGRDGSP